MTIATRPVLIHSGWRTGSTYFWSKFRRQPACTAFYEPFNELLLTLTADQVRQSAELEALMHHPPAELPYLHEYLPLPTERGFPLFQEEFCYKNYFRASGDLSDQRAYIEMLLDRAAQKKGTAVLGLVRSLGRVPWFKRTFDALNIVLVRSPVSQWASGRFQALNNNLLFFELGQLLILSQAQGCAAAAEEARRLGIPRMDDCSLATASARLADIANRYRTKEAFDAFMSVYMLSLWTALPYADLTVDMDLMSSNPAYRAKITEVIAQLTGFELDFSDCKMPRYGDVASADKVCEVLETMCKRLVAGPPMIADEDSLDSRPDDAGVRGYLSNKIMEDVAILRARGAATA
jgi:hypothetical protein